MSIKTYEYSVRRDVKSKSLTPRLIEKKLISGIRLSIDHFKLPYINQAFTTKRDHIYHCKQVRKNIELFKTDENLYKGSVRLYLQDVEELLLPLRRNRKSNRVKLEATVFESPISKSDISQDLGVSSEEVVDETLTNQQHSSASLEEIWDKFESAIDEQTKFIRKHRKTLKILSKKIKLKIPTSME